ncbi:tetratricopeptide repeat protein [Sphingosinicella soli]|uniref:Putative Zn-dependent protease n=1 Tax=Sphingosinicella soli TaxID=333708 RepID=A0A7W7B1M3_9SPHN|nr:tetratricopeptide repeat protein [Sphingosinicella soli]MBB4631368.1 putative Zn-dependent protease [Sphingosinicella soli]
MKMVSRTVLGFALALGVASGAMVAPAVAKDKKEAAPEQRKFKFSKKAQKALGEAQTAQQAGDNDAALVKIREAESLAETADDKYMANALKINVALAKQDNALLGEGLQGSIDSGSTTPEEKLKFQRSLAALAVQRNDVPGAIKVYEQMAAENPGDADIVVGLGEMYNRAGRTPEAVATIDKAIKAKQSTGQQVEESWYKRALALAYDGKLANQVTPASLALVQAYPSTTNWRDVLVIFRETSGLDDQGNLDVMRLMLDTNSLTGERDYFEYAETADKRGLAGEAKTVIDAGTAKGALSSSKPYVKELVSIVTPKVKSDRASLPGLEKEARADKTGRLAKATADGYLGYGENAKAIELYQLALQKGGVDAPEVNTRIGIALARSGDKAGAQGAFNAIQGGKRAEIAKFWLAHLNSKGAAQTASTTTGN